MREKAPGKAHMNIFQNCKFWLWGKFIF